MSNNFLQQIRQSLQTLNPGDVRRAAERPVRVGVAARSSAALAAIEDFLSPHGLSRQRRLELVQSVHRISEPGAPDHYDLEIYEEGMAVPETAFTFFHQEPDRLVTDILARREDLGLPLARSFPAFRKVVTRRIIHAVSRENAVFALATALPDFLPSLVELPWAIGQFASDTAFLTMNQVRMAFLLAAASDRPAGYAEQKTEIATIIGGAFGWRALARELVGKIPFGGGLIPKAAIAYAGTYVMGASFERLYRIGYGFTRAERSLAYRQALQRGRHVAGSLLEGARGSRPARPSQ